MNELLEEQLLRDLNVSHALAYLELFFSLCRDWKMTDLEVSYFHRLVQLED